LKKRSVADARGQKGAERKVDHGFGNVEAHCVAISKGRPWKQP
jgi:hypothetical protein